MKNFQDLVQEALKKVPEVDIYQLKDKIESNKQIKLIDIREDREWVSGRIPSAFHIGRGVLEKGIFEVANSDDEIILILSNMVKQRKQSIIQYEEGGRIELAEREREEIKIIQEFLPNQLTNEEIQTEISKIIDAEEQLSIKDMGKIMGELKNKFSGRMDFGKASEIVKALLK